MSRLTPIKSNIASLQTICWLRLLAVIGQSMTVAVVHGLLQIPLPLYPMLCVTLALLFFNLYSVYCLRQAQQASVVISDDFLAVQFAVDIMALAMLLYCSGGAFNPFTSFFLLPLALAAAILPLGYTVNLVILTIFLYASLMHDFVPLAPIPAHLQRIISLHILGMSINFVVSACVITGFISYLSSKVRIIDRQLAITRENQLRQEQLLALGTFAAGTAHELSTPLTTITILADEIEIGVGTQATHQTQKDIILLKQQVAQCKTLLKGMLQRVESATLQKITIMPTHQLILNVLEKFQLLRPTVPIGAPLFTLASSLPIACDATLEQALLNLLNNAADASSNHVEIHIDSHYSQIIIDILDRGSGLSQNSLAHIGQIFHSTKGEQGMGIGVFLANATLERLGGDVVFLTREGGGTIARVFLPIHSPNQTNVPKPRRF